MHRMCAVKSSYQYVALSLISCVWRVCGASIVHDGDFSACHASRCVGRMFILSFSYLDHLAPNSRHRSGDFFFFLQAANTFTSASPIDPGHYTRVNTFDGAHSSYLKHLWTSSHFAVGLKPDRASPYPSGNIGLT